jgi:hypothetical protein
VREAGPDGTPDSTVAAGAERAAQGAAPDPGTNEADTAPAAAGAPAHPRSAMARPRYSRSAASPP